MTDSDTNKSNNGNRDIPAEQEKLLLETIPVIKRIASQKLSYSYRDFIEDITQKVFLKLWNWKNRKADAELSEEEWKKLANTATHNEINTFYARNAKNEISLESFPETAKFLLKTETEKISGNSRHESFTLISSIWKTLQTFSLRQKYAILLQNQEFIVDLIASGVCKLSDVAVSLQLKNDVLAQIIRELPLPDEKICRIFSEATGEKISPKNIWEARNKAKVKLSRELKKSGKP